MPPADTGAAITGYEYSTNNGGDWKAIPDNGPSKVATVITATSVADAPA